MKLGITKADYDILKAQLDVKKASLKKLGFGLGDALSRTGSFPASSPEYAAVHLEIKNLEQSVGYLKNVLAKYVLIDPAKEKATAINTYSRVQLEDTSTSETVCYYISLGELERELDDCSSASPESPVGQALLGHKLGDLLQIKLPGGSREYRVTSHQKEY
jgi:transcription elongation factor GreA